jgi:hypothetical protein
VDTGLPVVNTEGSHAFPAGWHAKCTGETITHNGRQAVGWSCMIWIWFGFVLFILALLALDLGVFNRKAHVVSVKEACRRRSK